MFPDQRGDERANARLAAQVELLGDCARQADLRVERALVDLDREFGDVHRMQVGNDLRVLDLRNANGFLRASSAAAARSA